MKRKENMLEILKLNMAACPQERSIKIQIIKTVFQKMRQMRIKVID